MKMTGAEFMAWQNADWGHADAHWDDFVLMINGVEVDDYYKAAMRNIFPYKEVAAVAARDAESAHMETVTQEFDALPIDALPIDAGSIPEAPTPMAEEQAEPKWKRDDEKTMLRILLLSAETTGFHGNDPAAHMARIAKWTDAECRAVDRWCLAVHYQASDNEVQVPPKPDVISAPLGERACQPDDIKLTHERYMSRLIAADKHSHAAAARGIAAMISKETRYPEHHFNEVSMMILSKIGELIFFPDAEALALLDGIAFKLKHRNKQEVEDDLLKLRDLLTKH